MRNPEQSLEIAKSYVNTYMKNHKVSKKDMIEAFRRSTSTDDPYVLLYLMDVPDDEIVTMNHSERLTYIHLFKG